MIKWVGLSVIERSKQMGVKPKTRGRKLRSHVYKQGALKRKGVQQMGRKTGATCNSHRKATTTPFRYTPHLHPISGRSKITEYRL